MTFKDIELHDKSGMYGVINKFSSQIKEALSIGQNIKAGEYSFNKVIAAGMGGSAIGADLVRSYLLYEIKVPYQIIRGYRLPEYTDKDTLVILSSYSGGTEETLSCFEEAMKKTNNIICITSGGKLDKLSKEKSFLTINVPGGYQPRAALAYSFFTLLILFFKLKLVPDKSQEIENLIKFIETRNKAYNNPEDENNNALKIAKIIHSKLPVIYSSADVLDVVNLRWRCQLEENAKTIAYGNFFPELNHNEIVGWQINPDILKRFAIISLVDKNDHQRNKIRNSITLEMIHGMTGAAIELDGEGETFLERLMDLIYLGDWISFYLAILNKVDPTTIDKINYLKSKLTEQ